MTIKKIPFLSAAFSLTLLLSSCLGTSRQEEKMLYNYVDCFNAVTDIATGETSVRISPTYSFEFEYTTGTCEVVMNNISLPGVNGALSFKLEGLKFSFDKEGHYIINAFNVVPSGSAGAVYSFNNFSLKFMDRILNNSMRVPAYYINYTVNNKYKVNVVSTKSYYFGETIVKSSDDKADFTTPNTYYIVRIDPQDQKATVEFNRAQFNSQMPMLNFTLRDLSYTVTADGYVIAPTTVLIPYVNNETPNPSFAISDFKIDAVTFTGGKLSFSCNPPSMGQFNVNCDLKWTTPYLTPEQ